MLANPLFLWKKANFDTSHLLISTSCNPMALGATEQHTLDGIGKQAVQLFVMAKLWIPPVAFGNFYNYNYYYYN
jgi:hypothetical protein